MVMRLEAPIGDREAQRFLRGLEDQMPFVMAMTLTRLAKDVQGSLRGYLRQVIHQPTAFTLRGLRITPAKKTNLESSIWLQDEATKGTAPAQYLQPLIEGGTRRHKRSEKALQRRGILPSGWYVVPGKDARLNRSGNITSGTYTKILSELQASPDPGQNATDSRRSLSSRRKYFVLRRGESRVRSGRPIGVYQRTGKRTLKSILHFTPDTPTYTRIIDFEQPAEKVVKRRARKHFFEALARAARSARKREAQQAQRQTEQALRSVVQTIARAA